MTTQMQLNAEFTTTRNLDKWIFCSFGKQATKIYLLNSCTLTSLSPKILLPLFHHLPQQVNNWWNVWSYGCIKVKIWGFFILKRNIYTQKIGVLSESVEYIVGGWVLKLFLKLLANKYKIWDEGLWVVCFLPNREIEESKLNNLPFNTFSKNLCNK